MSKEDIVLVADSGSTKTDWIMSSQEYGIAEVRTSGINPVRDSRDAIFHVITEELVPRLPSGCKPSVIYFYGAGCMQPYSHTVLQVLGSVFPVARAHVESDLLGAARALCGNRPGRAYWEREQTVACMTDMPSWLMSLPWAIYLVMRVAGRSWAKRF